MKRRLGSRVLLGLLILLFVFGVGVLMLDTKSRGVEGSAVSSEEGGRRALLLVLGELGIEAQAWRGSPNTLPQGEHLLWMASAPTRLDGDGDDESADEDEQPEVPPDLDGPKPIHADPRHPLNYGVFVRAGGTLVLPYSAANLEWLRESCSLEVPDWPYRRLRSDATIELESGEALRVAFARSVVSSKDTVEDGSDAESPTVEVGDDEEAFDPRAHATLGWHDVAWLENERPFASWVEVGYGRVAFVGDDRFLRNDRLESFDNGLAAVRLVDALRTGGRVLFDEYALGLWLPLSKTELLTTGGLFEIALHAVLLFLLVSWFYGWVREFPRDPVEPPLNPRLRVQSLAALHERARAFDPLAEELRRGVLGRLTRRLGVRTRVAGAKRARAELVKDLRERAPLHALDARWGLFESISIGSRAELEELGSELAALENVLLAEPAGGPRT